MTIFTMMVLAIAGQVQPKDDALTVALDVYPDSPMLGDPIYLRVSVSNTSDEPQKILDNYRWASGHLEIRALAFDKKTKWRFQSPFYVYEFLRETTLPPDVTKVVAREAIDIPFDVDSNHSFWKILFDQPDGESSGAKVFLQVVLYSKEEKPVAKSPMKQISVSFRPTSESKIIRDLWPKLDTTDYPFYLPADPSKPLSQVFGYPVRGGYRVIDALLDQPEDAISGTLGNYLAFYRKLKLLAEQTKNNSPDAAQTLDELGEWLDSLDPIERECLILHFKSPQHARFHPVTQQMLIKIADEILKDTETM